MGLITKFSSVGSATMASRVLGFVREALIASTLGAGPVADAFYAAFRFPNLFRRLFAEGAFNSAFIPLFAKELEGGGKQSAREFAEQVFSVLLFILLLLSGCAMLFTPFLVSTVIAPRFYDTPDKFNLTVALARIMFPYLAAMSIVAMLSGILNAFRRYFLAAFAPVLLNVVVICVLLYAMYLQKSDTDVGYLLSYGVVSSGVLQLLLLLYGVLRQDFFIRLRFPKITPQVKRVLVLAAPAAATGGITQINLLVGQIIASAQDGAISILSYADRIYQLPLGVIGIGIGVVLLPELARALRAEDVSETAHLQNRSLEFGLGLTIPAAVGLAIMPQAIIAVLFERGAFSRETTILCAQALAFFSLGLPAFVLIKIFSPAYFAREDMKTPMYFSAASVITNITGSLLLFPKYGLVGIAAATSIAAWVNTLLLVVTLYIRKEYRPALTTFKRLSLILIGSSLMGGVVYFVNRYFSPQILDGALPERLAIVGGTILMGVLVYAGWLGLTGIVQKKEILGLIRRG